MTIPFNYVPQGWQCPKCGRVMSPSVAFCPCSWPRPTYTTGNTDDGCWATGHSLPATYPHVYVNRVCGNCGRVQP